MINFTREMREMDSRGWSSTLIQALSLAQLKEETGMHDPPHPCPPNQIHPAHPKISWEGRHCVVVCCAGRDRRGWNFFDINHLMFRRFPEYESRRGKTRFVWRAKRFIKKAQRAADIYNGVDRKTIRKQQKLEQKIQKMKRKLNV